MANYGTSTTAIVTADAQTVATTYRVRIHVVSILSGGGGGGIVSIKSGGSSGTVYLTLTGTASTSIPFNFGDHGILLPAGMYVDVDTNTTSVSITYHNEVA